VEQLPALLLRVWRVVQLQTLRLEDLLSVLREQLQVQGLAWVQAQAPQLELQQLVLLGQLQAPAQQQL
jgi:hypothetical protein